MQTPDFSKTLFVCSGNVYRSYISEQILRGVCKKINKNNIICWSRGIELYYKSPHPEILRYCKSVCEYDFNSTHIPLLIKEEDVQNASIIIGFTQSHIDYILKKFPEAQHKTILFSIVFKSMNEITEDISYDDVSIMNSTLQFNILSIIQAIENRFLTNNVSVIIPVHNEIKNISRLLKQISDQIYNNDEIIVISSASDDGTDEEVKSVIKDKGNHIKLIQQKTREGKVSALKLGLEILKNKTVILIDGDIKISENFRSSLEELDTNSCFTGKILIEMPSINLINKVSYVSTEAWNNLRKLLNGTAKFLYPSGYCMIMPYRFLQYALLRTDNRTVNDDGHIAIELYKKNVLFKYNSDIEVLVKFPQTWSDFLIQKVRTRLGRIQKKSSTYMQTEQFWRQQVLLFLNKKYFMSTIILLIIDFTCRVVAKLKLLFKKNHQIWTMIKSSK